MSESQRVRVVVADDSAMSRKVLGDLIASSIDMELVATVKDGREAVREVKRSRPDVLLMDVLMPVVNGLDATDILMRESPLPIVLVSELVGRDAGINFKAMEVGALDVLRKPSYDELTGSVGRSRFLRKLQSYSQVPVVRRHRIGRDLDQPNKSRPAPRAVASTSPSRQLSLVCIGASTGGPPAIRRILNAVDGKLNVPLLICQHMTEGFIDGMARWLDEQTETLRVSVATDREAPCPGHAYLAPDNAHLRYEGGRLRVDDGSTTLKHRPSVDLLFASVADSAACSTTLAILLTGMGDDGAKGLLRIRNAGGETIAQDEASSIVYGMPRVASELGAAAEILALDEIGLSIKKRCLCAE
jgi:two-component system chemotaxis response regulator CheB